MDYPKSSDIKNDISTNDIPTYRGRGMSHPYFAPQMHPLDMNLADVEKPMMSQMTPPNPSILNMENQRLNYLGFNKPRDYQKLKDIYLIDKFDFTIDTTSAFGFKDTEELVCDVFCDILTHWNNLGCPDSFSTKKGDTEKKVDITFEKDKVKIEIIVQKGEEFSIHRTSYAGNLYLFVLPFVYNTFGDNLIEKCGLDGQIISDLKYWVGTSGIPPFKGGNNTLKLCWSSFKRPLMSLEHYIENKL